MALGFNNTVGDSRGNEYTLHPYTNLHQPDIIGNNKGGQPITTGNKVTNPNANANNTAAQQFFSE